MIVELGAGLAPDRLEHVLARTLHDPSLRVAFWLPERGAFVDSRGAPVAVTPTAAGRALTVTSSTTAHRSRCSCTTRRSPSDPELVMPSAAPRAWRWRTSACTAELQRAAARAARRRAPGSSRRPTPRAGGSSATCTTARSSGSSRSRCSLRLARGEGDRRPDSAVAACSTRRGDELARRWRSCASSPAASTPRCSPTRGLGPALASRSPTRASMPAVVEPCPPSGCRTPSSRPPTSWSPRRSRTRPSTRAAASVTVDAQVQHGVLVVSVVDDGVGGADPEAQACVGWPTASPPPEAPCGWPVPRAAARG